MGNGLSLTGRFLAILVVGAAVLIGAAGPAQAFVIDTFTATNNPMPAPPNLPAPPPPAPPFVISGAWGFTNVPSDGWAMQTQSLSNTPAQHTGQVHDTGIAGVWGGNRTATSSSPDARLSQPVGFSVDTVNGLLSSFTASQSSTTLTLSYGPGDLTGVTSIEVDYRADHDATADLKINGNPVDGTQNMIGDAAIHTLIFAFDPLFGAGSTIDLIFNANPQALDLELFEIRGDRVPEPLSLAIWALTGLAGVGLVRVSRRREE